MLPKYYRLRMKWVADQTLTYDNGARIAIRMLPWKMVNGVLTYGTVITDDLGFGAGETIATTVEVEGTAHDNTTNLYWGIHGTFQLTADANSTDGTAYLYVEFSDDNSTWPSDADDFEITDLTQICSLPFTTDAEDEDRMRNFVF